VATAVFWVRSYGRVEYVRFFLSPTRACSVTSIRGGVQWQVVRFIAPRSDARFDAASREDLAELVDALLRNDSLRWVLGVDRRANHWFSGGQGEGQFLVYRGALPVPPSYWYGYVVTPYWALQALTAVLPAVWVVRWLRGRRRGRGGLCPACGYDLRATPGRCPECGRAVAES
jgi:hypothetical protein